MKFDNLPYNYCTDPISIDCEEFDCSIPVPIYEEPGLYKIFTEHVKKNIYKSLEYKRWVKTMKINDSPIVCCVKPELSYSIDLHHHPITLIDYVRMGLNYMESCKFAYTSSAIEDLILRWHYEGIICYCYINRSSHEEFHSVGTINIPEECIYGDMEKLISHPIMKFMDEKLKSNFQLYCPTFYNNHLDFFEKV